ncbi:hypothetical protein N566_06610 [Streptomycetaceae bacterium MP113-05]|nr:hypothetical protein N566_06610 [Streptomycetaceae bacterium MP113-05]
MTAALQADRPDSVTPGVADTETFEQAVPRTLVHRSAISEVLLTGIRHSGGARYRIGAQWPRSHSYYGVIARRWHDPMVFAESIRQAGLLLAHQALHIRMGSHFLTESLSFGITESGARLSRGPANVVLDVVLSHVERRRNVVSAFTYQVTAYREGERIGSGSTTARCVSPAVYSRLRGHRASSVPSGYLPVALAPQAVGRSVDADVVLGAATWDGARILRADPDHPVLFDHPVDHIPGMVVMEAARQAALVTLGLPAGLLLGCHAEFRSYIEFDPPCLVSVPPPQPGAAPHLTRPVEFVQAGSVAATCTVTVHDGSGA